MLIDYKHEKFDPNWIIELVKEQEPDLIDVIDALKKCTKGQWKNKGYIYFLYTEETKIEILNRQLQGSALLEHETEGLIVIDVLKDGRIGGIEFVKNLFQGNYELSPDCESYGKQNLPTLEDLCPELF